MAKKIESDIALPPMKRGDRAQHVITGEIVTVVTSVPGLVQAYIITGRASTYRATEMELIRLPKK